MENFESWTVANEVIASIPFTFGYCPRESLVVTCCSVEPGVLRIGASARLDLGAAVGPGAADSLAQVLAVLARTNDDAAIATVFTDREPGRWVRNVLEVLSEHWPFTFHGGCYVVSGEWIHGFSADGVSLGVEDALELATTTIAMSHPACEFVQSPEDYRFRRTVEGTTTAMIAADLGTPADTVRASALFQTELRRGGPTTTADTAILLRALEDVAFRDGVLAWLLAGQPADVEDFSAVDVEAALGTSSRPDSQLLERAYGALSRIARFAPTGRAAAPLALAAYLAWYAGDGTRARILSEQAIGEDPDYALTRLVARALAHACPPPWFGTDAA
ncbi:MAG: DUF4192 family protein [Actinomycetales bacterium]|nr:DUF4192 family protein [Actinomycetales bacterium]